MADNRRDKVQLGCGTLILIALIVLIFSGGNRTCDCEAQIKALHKEVLILETKIDALTSAIGTTHQPSVSESASPERQEEILPH